MPAPVQLHIGLLAAALWWGSLTALGFVVVPMLFMHLPSPATAGAMAAKLFSAQTWIGAGCALLMLALFKKKSGFAHYPQVRVAIKFIVFGLLLALLVELAIAPRIVNARADGGNLRLWHGLGSAMLVGQWLCAGFVLWCLSKPAIAQTTDKAE